MRKLLLVIVMIVVFTVPVLAVEMDYTVTEVFLWPDVGPGSEGLNITEAVTERSKNPSVLDRAISGVTKPSIIPMFPESPNGTAVVICPGGAYQRVVVDKEGYDIGTWLNEQGITAFILKYRLPGQGHKEQVNVPLQDAQRAIRLIRSKAEEWNIDGNKIGVIGFSAGGHLASTIATKYDYKAYEALDEIDTLSAKPNFAMFIYPVISLSNELAHAGSRKELLGANPSEELIKLFSNELQVNRNTPPTFFAHAHNDGVSTLNSIRYYTALKENNVSAELHIFRDGGHGFGIRGASGTVANWPMLAKEWLKSLGYL